MKVNITLLTMMTPAPPTILVVNEVREGCETGEPLAEVVMEAVRGSRGRAKGPPGADAHDRGAEPARVGVD
jgi:hypothetical protein